MISHKVINLENKINPNDIVLELNSCKNIEIMISNSLYHFLTKSKKRIDNNVQEWDFFKKITNPYEFIHTPPFNKSHHAVANYNAISRSFYKLVEIVNYFHLLDRFKEGRMNTFHLAEGPGGFIEALIYLRKKDIFSKQDRYHGITLVSNNRNIPKWWKLMDKFRFYENITIENGKTGNGDILVAENFSFCCSKYQNSMDFMTGDGGFDFSLDYEKQEIASLKLIYAQIMYAIMLQKKGGTFVLKIFDIFYRPSIELIYLLNCFYENIEITKPKTSRFANSEKYLVCTGFLFDDTREYFQCFLNNFNRFKTDEAIESIFKIELPLCFVQNIEEISAILGKKQLTIIHNTLMLIQEKRNDKIDKMKKTNIDKCIQWCNHNNIPFHYSFKPANIFTKHIHK